MNKQQAQALLKEIEDIITMLQRMEEFQKQDIVARIEKSHMDNSTGSNINDQ